ncbi:MAG: sigma-70 family RNA polymerase sigma factor [Caldilineae bacterium]|nr:sigma-70 family RNA polymerase sigma factor [Chloroflexota bacterium]MCB9176411.1 sigma-70 family RNA polymerase sigma factor [Caldilineae bacterium]
MSEAALRERAIALDPGALGEIYDTYAGKLYGYIYHRTGDAKLSEDLAGDVFVRMLEAIRSDRGWNTSLQGWLYRIAHNLIIDHFRRASNREGVELDERWMAPAEPGFNFEGVFASNQLRLGMRFLTDEQQQVVILKFVEGLGNAEVAEIMGKTEGAIKALQHRALNALRNIVETQVEV